MLIFFFRYKPKIAGWIPRVLGGSLGDRLGLHRADQVVSDWPPN